MARVFQRHLGRLAQKTFGPLTKRPVPRRIQRKMVRRMKPALVRYLRETVEAARRDGNMPFRTGRSYAQMLRGGRAFGTTFRDIRGHILGPVWMAAHEAGAVIRPQNAQALAIPLFDALRADGTPKFRSPNQWRRFRSFIYKSKRTGKTYIARRREDGSLSVLYVLVDMVELRENQGFIEKPFERNLVNLLEAWGEIFADVIAEENIEDWVARAAQGRRF